jgi:hypothetical protein
MGVRRVGENHIRSITKNNSGTYQISVPINLIRNLKWQQGQKVVVEQKGKSLTISDWKL